MPSIKIRQVWFWIVVFVTLSLFFHNSRWLALQNLGILIGRQEAFWQPLRAAGSLRDDPTAQFGLAMALVDTDKPTEPFDMRLSQLEAYAAMHPDRPEFDVAIMRAELAGPLKSLGAKSAQRGAVTFPPLTPSNPDLAVYTTAAANATRLAPGNAYVAVLSAVGLYAEGRANEGYAELERASRCGQWDAYGPKAMAAQCQLKAKEAGGDDGLVNWMLYTRYKEPEYPAIRRLLGVVVNQAVDEEHRGNVAAGVVKRRNVRKIATLIYSQSPGMISMLMGYSISVLSWYQPHGDEPELTHAKRYETNARTTEALMRAHGFAADADEVEAALQGRQAIEANKPAIKAFADKLTKMPIRMLAMRFSEAAQLVLVFWCSVIALIASAIHALTRQGTRSAWSPSVSWGVFFAMCAAVLVWCAQLVTKSHTIWSVPTIIALVWVFGRWIARPKLNSYRQFFAAYAVGLAILFAVHAAIFAQANVFAAAFDSLRGEGAGPMWLPSVPLIALLMTAPAIIVSAIAAAYAAAKRRQVGPGIVNALRLVLPYIAALAALLYSHNVTRYVEENGYALVLQRQMLKDEPSIYANFTHRQWPGRQPLTQ